MQKKDRTRKNKLIISLIFSPECLHCENKRKNWEEEVPVNYTKREGGGGTLYINPGGGSHRAVLRDADLKIVSAVYSG